MGLHTCVLHVLRAHAPAGFDSHLTESSASGPTLIVFAYRICSATEPHVDPCACCTSSALCVDGGGPASAQGAAAGGHAATAPAGAGAEQGAHVLLRERAQALLLVRHSFIAVHHGRIVMHALQSAMTGTGTVLPRRQAIGMTWQRASHGHRCEHIYYYDEPGCEMRLPLKQLMALYDLDQLEVRAGVGLVGRGREACILRYRLRCGGRGGGWRAVLRCPASTCSACVGWQAGQTLVLLCPRTCQRYLTWL